MTFPPYTPPSPISIGASTNSSWHGFFEWFTLKLINVCCQALYENTTFFNSCCLSVWTVDWTIFQNVRQSLVAEQLGKVHYFEKQQLTFLEADNAYQKAIESGPLVIMNECENWSRDQRSNGAHHNKLWGWLNQLSKTREKQLIKSSDVRRLKEPRAWQRHDSLVIPNFAYFRSREREIFPNRVIDVIWQDFMTHRCDECAFLSTWLLLSGWQCVDNKFIGWKCSKQICFHF